MKLDKIKRVHIAGPYGSGKSTLAKELSNILNLKVYELDELKYDRKNNRERSEKEMGSILKKIVQMKKWIIEGAWSDRAADSFKKADLVIILNPSYSSLIYNHFKRIVTRQKKFTLAFNLKLLKKSIKYSLMTKHPSLHSHVQQAKTNKRGYFLIKNKKELKSLINQVRS